MEPIIHMVLLYPSPLLPWITPELPLHCLQPIYTASSSLAVIETTLCLAKKRERHPQLPESVTFHFSQPPLGTFQRNYINFIFNSGWFRFFWSVFVCLFLILWSLRAHRWHTGSRGSATHLICTLGSLSASNRLSLVTLDGFKCQRAENELRSAVCHHWLMTNYSHGGKLEAANSCGFNFCLDTLRGKPSS